MSFKRCSPISLALDVSINGMYLLCYRWDEKRYIILRKSFINRISKTIYSGTTGMLNIVSEQLLTGLYSNLSVTTDQYDIPTTL